jgi:hypothetical protein
MKTLFALTAAAAMAVLGATAAQAGAIPGPKIARGEIPARGVDSYTVVFAGKERAEVGVKGDGDTNLDLYVYDENGNLVAGDEGSTDVCLAVFTPRWTGKFTIVVVNRGLVPNDYTIVTN